MSVNIETTRTKERILISVPTDNFSAEEINEILTFFKMDFLARRSKMTEAEAIKISEEIKADWWKKNKSRIEKMIAKNE